MLDWKLYRTALAVVITVAGLAAVVWVIVVPGGEARKKSEETRQFSETVAMENDAANKYEAALKSANGGTLIPTEWNKNGNPVKWRVVPKEPPQGGVQ